MDMIIDQSPLYESSHEIESSHPMIRRSQVANKPRPPYNDTPPSPSIADTVDLNLEALNANYESLMNFNRNFDATTSTTEPVRLSSPYSLFLL